MKANSFLVVLLTALLSTATVPVALAKQPVLPEPEKIVRQMCTYLKSIEKFSFRAEVTYDKADTAGNKLQYTFDMKTFVRRPDSLRVDAKGDLVNKQFFFDGKTITLYDRRNKVYATMDAPPDIEGALDRAHKDFNLRVALADLASPNLYELLTKDQHSPLYVGMHKVRGVTCHHVAFDRKNIQVQLWIDAGNRPLLRKIVITEKRPSDSPQWSAYLSNWNVSAKLDESVFAFAAPPGVKKARFIAAQKPDASRQKPQTAR